MALYLHLLPEGEHGFAIDEYHRDTGRRHFARVGSTLHMGSGPTRIIETIRRDEDAGLLTVQVRHSEDFADDAHLDTWD